MQSAARQATLAQVEAAHDAIRDFLKSSSSPALLEPGEAILPLQAGSFDLTYSAAGGLTLHAWDRDRTILRRITRVLHRRSGHLELETAKFGKRTGTLSLIDTARPQTKAVEKKGQRLAYREAFRRSLARQFPGWRIAELSCDADLERSLSPAYARAVLEKGQMVYAAMGAGPDCLDPDGVLTYALIWLEQVRRKRSDGRVAALGVFLPQGCERVTCLRARFLTFSGTRLDVFAYTDGFEQRVDLADYGNLDTSLAVYSAPMSLGETPVDAALARILAHVPGAEAIPSPDGSVSFRIRGLEFARKTGSALVFGLETKVTASPSNLPEVEAIALRLAELRVPESDRRNLLYSRCPELWLESQVRRNIQTVDASLQPSPVYGQVPAFAGGDRGVIDLLACDAHGRLAVLELKASEDAHLPLQALDYWMRVRWHAERGDFSGKGYFPGIEVQPVAPRLLLIAPSLEFHPTTGTVLQFFSSGIDVERVGVNAGWRHNLQVSFRLIGRESRT